MQKFYMKLEYDDETFIEVQPTMRDYQDYHYKQVLEYFDNDKEMVEKLTQNKKLFYKVIDCLIELDLIEDLRLIKCDFEFRDFMKERYKYKLEWLE